MDLLTLIRSGRAGTRADAADLTGLGRATISNHLETLAAARLIRPAGELASTGGRPAALFEFNAEAGVVLAAEIGADHVRAAVTDLGADVIADVHVESTAAWDSERVLEVVDEHFVALLERVGAGEADVFGIGVGVAAPVEFAAARPVNPPIMPGWHEFPVGARMRDRWKVPALVDNDVNMMAVGEHATTWSQAGELLRIEVGEGIGCGIISGGRVHRGAQGAAGDIGHIRVPDHDDVVCNCGNRGCLEAVIGGGAIAVRLSRQGVAAADGRDVARLVGEGNRQAVVLVRESGRLLGEVLAAAINILNPAVIILGGDAAGFAEPLLAGLRETVYRRSLPLATRHLQIVPSELSERAAVIGAAVTVIEHVLAPETFDATLSGRLAAR